MRIFVTLVLIGVALSPFTNDAFAQSCDAYFPLDGNLNDSSGNGYHGRMIAAEGQLAKPQFVDGKSGQALKLDGTSAMRAFVDLSYETCKQVTMTAWVMFEPGRPRKTNNIISTGGGSGPGLTASGSTLTLKGTANGLMQSNAIRDNAGWMFVAGVYDYSGDKYTLYWRGRSESKALGPNLRVPEEAIWIGGLNDSLSGAASGVVVDEVRIFGRLLSEAELRAMQARRGPDFEAAPAEQQQALASCTTQADCGSGTYCAFDNSCHPERHLPKREIELALAPVPAGNEGGGGTSSGMPSAVPGVADRLPAGGGLSDEANAALQDRANENRPPEIGYASEEEALAAAERREREEYQAELSRQQNELERQRREAAAAEESASSTSPESDPGTVIGWKLSATDFKQTLVSGETGEIIRVIDTEHEPITGMRVFEPNNVPCLIHVYSGDDTNRAAASLNECTVPIVPAMDFSIVNTAIIAPAVVSSLRVCHSFQNNNRVKGVSISGNIMNADGSPGFYQQAQGDGPNCFEKGWQGIVACDSGYAASGVVAHFKDRDFSESLTGLALICRKIEKIYE